ncbi:MAG: thioredoxin family protein [Muribaculaceae bacterium]|nr:thioredoxin family protein [Muribaculaceae bacterium]
MKHNLKGFSIQWLLLPLLLVSAWLPVSGQQFGLGRSRMLDPINWKATVEGNSTSSATIRLTAEMEEGWHLYGLDLPADGPNSTVIDFQLPEGVKFDGPLTPSRKPVEKYDDMFSLNLSWWEGSVSFTQKVKISDEKTHTVGVEVSFQGCNDETCIAPKTESLEVSVGTGPVVVKEDKADTVVVEAPVVAAPAAPAEKADLWAPVEFSEDEMPEQAQVKDSPWWVIFIWGFGGGLLALLTPCVWPMIPMTVSFFLKKGTSRRKSVGDAVIYGLSIIVIYLTLGLAITGIFGASKLNELSTNAVFNLCFFLLLVVFGISFLGGFDIKLPSKWSNSTDARAEKATGLVSIFFMAFTLALVSFSCTGPIIGTLLVEAATMGNFVGPAIGMGGFALALALPFSLFALFPSWLKEMPRSGGWLNSVKVVLGFLELALSLKFLSVADLAYGWGVLDREVFICLWVVLFAMLGFYLLGKLKFSHDADLPHVSLPRFFLSLASFGFALYLIPGLWGAPLKGVSAFVPPLFTQDFNLYAGGQFEEFDDYDKGMAYAAESNRPVLVDFSGYGCVNCRKMEGAVFDTGRVSSIVKENFVLIKLMVDDKTKLPEPMTVEENGKKVVLKTVGDKWSYLQRHKFSANSQPYYIILNHSGEAVSAPYFYDENVGKFVGWLEGGMKNYSENPD